jgi:hypothetical protein
MSSFRGNATVRQRTDRGRRRCLRWKLMSIPFDLVARFGRGPTLPRSLRRPVQAVLM